MKTVSEQKNTSKRNCTLIKERTRNVTHRRVQGNGQAPQAQTTNQQVQVQETQTTTSSRKIQRSSKIRDTYWTETSTSSLIDFSLELLLVYECMPSMGTLFVNMTRGSAERIYGISHDPGII